MSSRMGERIEAMLASATSSSRTSRSTGSPRWSRIVATGVQRSAPQGAPSRDNAPYCGGVRRWATLASMAYTIAGVFLMGLSGVRRTVMLLREK